MYKDCGCDGDSKSIQIQDICVILIDHLQQVLCEQIQHIVIAGKLELPHIEYVCIKGMNIEIIICMLKSMNTW